MGSHGSHAEADVAFEFVELAAPLQVTLLSSRSNTIAAGAPCLPKQQAAFQCAVHAKSHSSRQHLETTCNTSAMERYAEDVEIGHSHRRDSMVRRRHSDSHVDSFTPE